MANPTGRGGFKPGQSGNPGGRPKAIYNLTAEARRHTIEAVRTLLRLMRNAKSESVRLGAAEAILSRGWGKPIQALQIDGGFAAKKLNELSDAELAQLEERLASMAEDGQGLLFDFGANGSGRMN